MFKKLVFISCVFLLLISCSGSKPAYEIPKTKYHSFQVEFNVKALNDSLIFTYNNTSYSPLRFNCSSQTASVQEFFKSKGLTELLLEPHSKKRLAFKNTLDLTEDDVKKIKRKVFFGDVYKDVKTEVPIAYPYPIGKTYAILQGNNTSFTHNQEDNRYALDFKMTIGEEIIAVYDGIVVSSIDQYTIGGRDKRLEPYGNYITIYHKDLGTYSTYFHLNHNGSLVKPGDSVKQYQVIGYSGHTGYSTEPHLHFVYYRPEKLKGLISIPIHFKDGSKSTELKKHTRITHVE